MNSGARWGLLAAGNFIVDRIKRIDAYPAENMLANIEDEVRSNGGGPYNVLKDLAAMGDGYPLFAAGLIGADSDGDWIVKDCRAHGIDVSRLLRDPAEATSYTDVMTARETGRRTFFHRRGANARFDGADLDFESCPARIFHLAYLLLLDEMDRFTADGRTRASRLLEKASAAGMITSVDIVSTDHPRFREIVLSALPHTDHLLINEVEACRVLGWEIDPADASSLQGAAMELFAGGVRGAVVLHSEHGAVRVAADGSVISQAAVRFPVDSIRGANGAGDAFAAGYLHGVHEDLTPADTLELAVCAAAACLRDPSPSGGIVAAGNCLELGRAYGFSGFGPLVHSDD